MADSKSILLLKNEILIFQKLSNVKGCTKLFKVLEDPHSIYLITEYHNKGDLFELMNNVEMDEEFAKYVFVELYTTLKEIHANQIIYRDLKPENILIDREGHLKICDFNLAIFVNKKEIVRKFKLTLDVCFLVFHSLEINPLGRWIILPLKFYQNNLTTTLWISGPWEFSFTR
jgi:serine/threonine protein kinase